MGLTGRDIICLSTHYWDETWFRKQQFMSRFSRTNRVLFVEPSFSSARRAEPYVRALATNRHLRGSVERRSPNLFLLKPPRALPKWSAPRIEKLTYRWYSQIIGKVAQSLGFQNCITWVYRPSYYYGLDLLPYRQLVFDLVDDIASYRAQDSAWANEMEKCIAGLARQSDLLIVTAQTLADRYGGLARHATQVTNGFDRAIFSADRANCSPPELAGVRRPILGFIGTLFRHLDFELLEQVARAHHEKSVVLVGPIEAHAQHAVNQLTSLPNVIYIPAQPRSAVPAFIREFDVCLSPFRSGRLSDGVSPLKVYEYLAMGRPVVSTPMKSLRAETVAEAIAFADGAREFSRQIERSLTPEVQRAWETRQRLVAPYSWDQLFARVDTTCEAVLGDGRE